YYRLRVLDAWVARVLPTFRENYHAKPTVKDRSVFVPMPVILDGKAVPAATAERLGQTFARQRGCLLIWGEGGAGKTSLACRLGGWALADQGPDRLCRHRLLPVLIEHDLDLKVAEGKPAFQALTEAVRGQVQALIGDRVTLSEQLLEHLLRQRRILVIV